MHITPLTLYYKPKTFLFLHPHPPLTGLASTARQQWEKMSRSTGTWESDHPEFSLAQIVMELKSQLRMTFRDLSCYRQILAALLSREKNWRPVPRFISQMQWKQDNTFFLKCRPTIQHCSLQQYRFYLTSVGKWRGLFLQFWLRETLEILKTSFLTGSTCSASKIGQCLFVFSKFFYKFLHSWLSQHISTYVQ